jgi:hypothetical protein
MGPLGGRAMDENGRAYSPDIVDVFVLVASHVQSVARARGSGTPLTAAIYGNVWQHMVMVTESAARDAVR